MPAYRDFKTLMRCIEGWMMGFTHRERERESWGEPERVSACVPFIAQLSRKSLLMERHLQGISPLPLLWRMGRNGGDVHLKIEGGKEAAGRHELCVARLNSCQERH